MKHIGFKHQRESKQNSNKINSHFRKSYKYFIAIYIMVNLFKIRYLLHFLLIFFTEYTPTSNNIPFGVMSRFIFSTDQSGMSLLFKTKYMPRAVVWLVNILIFMHDSMVNDEWKITWHDPKRDVVTCQCIAKDKHF